MGGGRAHSVQAMIRPLTVLAATLAALALPAGAIARWSAPLALSQARNSPYTAPVVAVDSKGDAAVAWQTVSGFPPSSQDRACALAPMRRSCYPIVVLHLLVRDARGRTVRRTVALGRVNPTLRLSLALAGGDVTLAWGTYDVSDFLETAQAVFGPMLGRLSAPVLLGHFSDIGFTGGKTELYPQLAVAPDGRVLAAWSACRSASGCGHAGGVELASRAPGHGFSRTRSVGAAAQGALPQFDSSGRLYLVSACSGRVLLAAPGSLSFRRTVTLTAGPVSDLTLALSGAGEGLASWIAGACSSDQAVGNTPGPVMASLLRSGTFAAPKTLTAPGAKAFYLTAAAVPGGGALGWVLAGISGVPLPATALVGTPAVSATAPAGVVPLIADGGGDVLFGPTRVLVAAGPFFIRPAGGSPDQTLATRSGEAAVAPFGRAVAIAGYGGSATLWLSVWRP